MDQPRTLMGIVILSTCLLISTTVHSAETQKDDSRKGLTVEDLKRGLKSADQNIEKEIPKIGPAVGETFKKQTNKESEKPPAQSPAKDKK